MPLDTIYLTRHGHRLNWSLDFKTGEYRTAYPTPTGIPVDPPLTLPGVRQSHELADHLSSAEFTPKPCRVYCSAFYRCLQTIHPAVEALKELQESRTGAERDGFVELDVRIENGLGEWFGRTSTFTHPAPPSPDVLQRHFPTILGPPSSSSDAAYKASIHPPLHGESIAQLHDRVATTLHTIIADVDAEIAAYERAHPEAANQSRAILICSHAAPLIAMGRALTGNMPADSSVEDFNVFTAGLSTFVRRSGAAEIDAGAAAVAAPVGVVGRSDDVNGDATRIVPEWRGGRGVGGGWDCVANGECGFLSGGAERGWHFNGEEDFNSMPTLPTPEGAQMKGLTPADSTSAKL